MGFGLNEEGTACEECFPGTTQGQNMVTNVTCEPCAPGFFASTSQMSSCMPCGKGLYAASEGSMFCEACPDGGTTLDLASDSIDDCFGSENDEILLNDFIINICDSKNEEESNKKFLILIFFYCCGKLDEKCT